MNWIDYLVLVIILLIPIGIGMFFAYKNSKKKDLAEYLVASSDMGAVPIAFSLLATFVSTTTFLGK